MKITRREMAAALAAGPVTASPAAAAPQGADDVELRAALDRQKRNADAVNAVKIPMETEPAFQFKA
jgi:hypothetical protein